ncbi:TPA: DUF4014 family protein [Escherichia coli]|nr:DUF4014 family protein [Escherichia coli]
MPTLFRKEYPRRSRTIEFLFFIVFIVLLMPIFPLILVWVIGKLVEPVIKLYTDVTSGPFNALHNKINPYKES